MVFDKREQSFENKFAHDAETQFRIIAKRRKLLGVWAAEQLNLDIDKIEEYALQIVMIGIEDNKSGAVIGKILADFQANNVPLTEEDIRAVMEEMHQLATRFVMEME
jgi:hypothetical protein